MSDERLKRFSFTCACCGDKVEGLPSFALAYPPFIDDVPEDEREARVEYDSDLCFIRAAAGQSDEPDLFAIRATLNIPIHDADERFIWGVWVTQSEKDFRRYIDSVGTDQRGETSFGWLPITQSFYLQDDDPDAEWALPCDLLWQDAGDRPKVVLREGVHPLCLDQKNGLTWERALEIAQFQMKLFHSRN